MIILNTVIIPIAIALFTNGSAAAGKIAESAVVNQTAIVAHAIMLTIHFMTPTSYPKKSPKASLAYRYGPPDCSNMLPHSAKHSATDITKIRTKRYASKLDGPIN